MAKGKKEEQAKKEAKRARQVTKQDKAATKRSKKSSKEAGEQDIDAILAEFNAKESSRTAVSVSICDQPAPRANCTVTALPSSSSGSGEMLLFGGEFCDGQNTEVYSDLFRWQVERNEWKQIESLNTPPPRCAHQAVCYKDKLYVFGGEYATMSQFHHYRDFWELDLKTSTWSEVQCSGDIPTARSGHRMVVWRNFIVLFGGFYEAMREQRWYNDCYLYSFQDRRWAQLPHSQRANALVPKPRSGVSMCVNAAEDAVYIYGGFSKEKVTGSLKEGKAHEDMWALQLRPALAAAGGGKGSSGGSSSSSCGGLDLNKALWQKIKRRGDHPSTRCGAAMTLYRNKALLFGGVCDEEGPRHSMVSNFFNDLFAYDFERKRWYKLGLKQKKVKLSAAERKEARKVKHSSKQSAPVALDDGDEGSSGADSDDSNDEEDADEDDAEDREGDGAGTVARDYYRENAASNNLFGYIDETGKVVYIDLNADDEDEDEETEVADKEPATNSSSSELNITQLSITDASQLLPALVVLEAATANATATSGDVVSSSAVSMAVESSSAVAVTATDDAVAATNAATAASDEVDNEEEEESSSRHEKAVAVAASSEDAAVAVDASSSGATRIARYFLELSEPCPRINPCLTIRGNSLYIYGGVTELGDVEVTLDDCWSLDLNKRDTWKKVLQGTMHSMVWKGMDEDEEDDDDDGDNEDDDDEDDESHDRSGAVGADDSDGGCEDNDAAAGSGSARMEDGEGDSSAKKSSKKKKSGKTNVSIREEMEELRSQLDTTNVSRTPISGESLRQFYSRTALYWAEEVVADWRRKQEQHGEATRKDEMLSEKEIKRLAFVMSESRYNELLPVLERLNALEEQQADEESERSRPGSSSRRHGGGSSSSSSKISSSGSNKTDPKKAKK